ncbi:MAG: response regulator [Pseudomonadota bacterium]
MKKINVLVIDDNEVDRYVAARILKKSPKIDKIEELNGGLAALDLFQNPELFDERCGPTPPRTLVLLDINMPGMNGFELLEGILKLQEESKVNSEACIIAMLTSSGYGGDREQSLAYDMVSDYIEKPLNPEKLQVLIDRHYSDSAAPS